MALAGPGQYLPTGVLAEGDQACLPGRGCKTIRSRAERRDVNNRLYIVDGACGLEYSLRVPSGTDGQADDEVAEAVEG